MARNGNSGVCCWDAKPSAPHLAPVASWEGRESHPKDAMASEEPYVEILEPPKNVCNPGGDWLRLGGNTPQV